MPAPSVCVFWFRRDLRLEDNTGLAAALASGLPVVPLFIFDTEILGRLEDKDDLRVQFIRSRLDEIDRTLRASGSGLVVKRGRSKDVWRSLLGELNIKFVYFNRDYEPAAIARDAGVSALLAKSGVEARSFKDQVIFEASEVRKDSGGPYTVFTPYSRKWKALLTEEALRPARAGKGSFFRHKARGVPALAELGFRSRPFEFPSPRIDRGLLRAYGETRDVPALRGTSRLGVHLRFGTVSVRELAAVARRTSEAWLNELIWREFFMQILFHFPHVADGPFRPEYAGIAWRHDEAQFRAWREGRTGYPIVDAGMRELSETGFMHNRARMIAGSFLAKHLLIDWRWGEAHFARKLLDFDLAANNGNWQWVAGTGCDAAPYFRIFSPEAQTRAFDAKLEYARRWVPELGTKDYPRPIVDHAYARSRALAEYREALSSARPRPERKRV